MLAALGQDAFATPIESSLRDAGVTLHAVRTVAEPTGTAFICVSDDAENAITVAPGANQALMPQHLPALTGFSHLLLQLETPLPTVTAFAKTAKAQGVCVVLNAAPAQSLPAELLETIDVLVVNEGELATVSGHKGTIAECLERVQVPTVVVTLGHRGVCARHQGQILLQTAFVITPVDTTAAGDTFCGGLVAALCSGESMQKALAFGSAAGALACTRLGAQSSIPEHNEVQALLTSQDPDASSGQHQLRQFCGLPA